jgi:YD repeat-containing protein
MDAARAAGAWVKSQRLASGMTQEELSGKSGLSVRAISNLERGRTARPHPRSLEVLAVALGLPETEGAAWAARLRADQARDASSQAPRQLSAAGERSSQPHDVLTAASPGRPDGEPASPGASASPEQLERPGLAERPARQGAVPAPRPPAAMALAPLSKSDPSRIGSFRLLSRLGGGAMGEVFLAASRAGRPAAVKRVRAEYARDAVFRARFAKEVAAVRAVTGGHAPALIDADAEAGRPWIATAYVPGPSLAQAVDLAGPLPEPLVLALGGEIAAALAAIHAAGIVHRDLKPSNILLDRDGPKVIDFGISRALDGTALTATGTRVGTAGYTAPELAARRQTLPAGDVFALGCVLAYAATSVTPFGEGADAQVLYRVVHEPPDPRALACQDETLRALIEACLNKDPGARPTPQAVIDACRGTPPPGGSWLPDPLAAQAAAYGSEAARQLARAARRRAIRRARIGLAPLLILAIPALVVASTAARSPGAKGPAGWWTLTQSSGTTVPDSSGHGNVATASGVTWTSSGAKFTGGAGQKITTSGPVVDTTSSFSVSAWVNLTAITGNDEEVMTQDAGSVAGFYLQINGGDNHWSFSLPHEDENGPPDWSGAGSGPAQTGTWTFLAGVYNASTHTAQLYVNGTDTGDDDTDASTIASNGPLEIGAEKWNSQAGIGNFDGTITNAEAYPFALSAAQVASLYRQGRSGGDLTLGNLTTTYQVDQLGQVTAQANPDQATTTYAYDQAGQLATTTAPVLVENSATAVDLVFHVGCWYSLISPASLGRSWNRSARVGKGRMPGSSSGARRPMPWP